MNGSCLLLVAFNTSSRVNPKALRRSRPGLGRYLTRAAVNGLCLLSPSDAVDPAFAANAISVLGLAGGALLRPPARGRPPPSPVFFFFFGGLPDGSTAMWTHFP